MPKLGLKPLLTAIVFGALGKPGNDDYLRYSKSGLGKRLQFKSTMLPHIGKNDSETAVLNILFSVNTRGK